MQLLEPEPHPNDFETDLSVVPEGSALVAAA